MPKRPKFTATERPEGWMVSVPASMSGTGRRQRKFFSNKGDAEKFGAKLRTRYHEGERSGVIPREMAAQAAAAAALLAPHGLSLLDAGIRPSVNEGEITRLDWESVGKKEVFISKAISKTNSERFIPITPALRRAIKGHPKSGPVMPAGWKARIARIRAAAGISGQQDITRHTFASHFLAAYGEDATKNALGHAAGSRTLFQHYRRAIREAEGKAFFK